jgi:GTP cyclohydrolase I
METKKRNEELIEKIIHGLDLAHKKLIESTKRNNEELVILKDNKIVRVKPQ